MSLPANLAPDPSAWKSTGFSPAERARFDFPEPTYEGQPVGVPRMGSQANHQHNVLDRTEPTYIASPTQTAIASSPISMPKIKLSPQRDAGSERSMSRRDQGQYLDELEKTMVKKQYDIKLAQQKQQQYLEKMGENQFRSSPIGQQKISPQVSPDKLAEIAAKRKAQEGFAAEITRLNNAKPLPSGHQMLLRQQRPASPNYEAGVSEQTKILYGKGELQEVEPSQKLDMQQAYRDAILNARKMQPPPEPERLPRERPASPEAPLSGVNLLNTIGANDTPEAKMRALDKAKAIVTEQAHLTKVAEEMRREAEMPLVAQTRRGTNTPLNARAKKNEIPDRAPHFPSPKVAAAMQVQQQRAAEVVSATGQKTLTEENYIKKKHAQQQYAEALNSDRERAPVDEMLVQQNGVSRRISVHDLPQKGANTRNEKMLNNPDYEIVTGPNIIDAVGNYDYDRSDRLKKTVMQDEYRAQLDEAQKQTVPVSMSASRTPLMPQMKQRAELTPDPFHHGGVYLGTGTSSRSLEVDSSASHPGKGANHPSFNHNSVALDGLHVTEEAVRQMRADERAKAAEYYAAAVQDNTKELSSSPRGTTYKGHRFPPSDASTPYMAAADQMLQNRALLDEKLGQNPELYKELEEQVAAAVAQGYDADQAREALLKRLAHAEYQAQLANDAAKNAAVAQQAPDRVSLAAQKPGGSRGEPVSPRNYHGQTAQQLQEQGYGTGGLPMFNKPDWNELSLDYHWNSDQSVHYPEESTGKYRVPHSTHQMHYLERDGVSGASPRTIAGQHQVQPAGAGANTQGVPQQRATQLEAHRAYNTSLPLYAATPQGIERNAKQLHYDNDKALLMKNQDLYNQGLLTDRTAREHERQMSKYLVELRKKQTAREGPGPGQGSHYKPTQTQAEDFFVPNLTMKNALPEQASVDSVALQPSNSNPQIIASLATGHTPRARPEPPLGFPTKSPQPMSGLRQVGDSSYEQANARSGYTQPMRRSEVVQAGFRLPK